MSTQETAPRSANGTPFQKVVGTETSTTDHGSAPAQQLGTRTISELTTEELDQLVPALDATVRELVRVAPHDRDLDDLKAVAAACRIARRRRHGRARLNRAQQILAHVQEPAGGGQS